MLNDRRGSRGDTDFALSDKALGIPSLWGRIAVSQIAIRESRVTSVGAIPRHVIIVNDQQKVRAGSGLGGERGRGKAGSASSS